jgi:hypothetical protein
MKQINLLIQSKEKCKEILIYNCRQFKEIRDILRNEEVLQRVNEKTKVLQNIKRRKANWIGHVLCRNCLQKHVVEGKMEGRLEVIGRRGRRHN